MKRPCVFLHGLPDTRDVWQPLLDRLKSSGVEGLALELPGLGAADALLNSGVSLQELSLLLEARLPPEPAVYVGHDFGGILSILIARRHPERFAELILVNSAEPELLRSLMQQDGDQQRRSAYVPRLLSATPAEIQASDCAFLAHYLFREPGLSPIYQEKLLRAWSEDRFILNLKAYYRAFLEHPMDPVLMAATPWDRVSQIWSSEDLFLGTELQKQMQSKIPKDRSLVSRTGSHWLQISRPELLERQIQSRLRRLEGERG